MRFGVAWPPEPIDHEQYKQQPHYINERVHLDTSWRFSFNWETFNNRSRLAFMTTVTDDKDIAAPAITGLKSQPVKGKNTPAATGIPKLL